MEHENIRLLDLVHIGSSILEVIVLALRVVVTFTFLLSLVLIPILVLFAFAELCLVLVFLHLLIDLGMIIVASVFIATSTSLFQAPLQDFLEAGLEGLLHLAFSLALKLDWVSEALKQVHRVTVGLYVVDVLATEHIKLDSVPSEILDQECVPVVEGNLQTKDADKVQVSG